RWDQRYPANAQAVHGECTVELEKWEQTLHGEPWRTTAGAAPCAVKVACTVLNGGDEETYRKATRLVPTQLERATRRSETSEWRRWTRRSRGVFGAKKAASASVRSAAIFRRHGRMGNGCWRS